VRKTTSGHEHDVGDHRPPEQHPDHPGRDYRIEKDVNDRLADDPRLDATEVQVHASEGQVTLAGNVASHEDWRRAEDIAKGVPGVQYVMNNLRVTQHGTSGATG
jgi:osmotically-inducible protein OsmY